MKITEQMISVVRGVVGSRDLAMFVLEEVGPLILEQAAQIAENPGFIEARDTDWDEGVNFAKRFCAKAIRNVG